MDGGAHEGARAPGRPGAEPNAPSFAARLLEASHARMAVLRAYAARLWAERSAASRALAPALPLALAAAIASLALVVTPQGEEIVLILTRGTGQLLAFAWFMLAVFVFSVALMGAAVFVLATDRQATDAARPGGSPLLTRFERGRRSIPPDPIHTSVTLRTRAAFLIGLMVPFVLLNWAIRGWMQPEGPLMWLWALALTMALTWLFTASAPRAGSAIVFALRLAVLIVGVVFVVKALSDSATAGDYPLAAGAVFLALIGALYAVWRGSRTRLLVAHSDSSGQFVVIDNRFERLFHFLIGVVFLAFVAIIVAGAWFPAVFGVLGPGALFFFGMTGLTAGLARLIRQSLNERPERPAVRTSLKSGVPGFLRVWNFPPFRLAGWATSPAALFVAGVTLYALAARLGHAGAPGSWLSGDAGLLALIGAGALFGAWWLSSAFFANRPPWLLVLLPFFAMPLNDGHHIATAEERSAAPDAVEAAKAWLAPRLGPAGSEAPIRAYVVLAEGGGIRAAAHTNAVLSSLEEETNGAFFDHVYALSGVSGGSVGIAAHLAAQAEAAAGCQSAFEASRQVLATDHFSALIGGLLGADIPAAMLPVEGLRMVGLGPWPDRADLFENSLDAAWRREIAERCGPSPAGPSWFEQPLEQVAAKAGFAGAPPIVLFSTVRAETGELAVASNAVFANCDEETGLKTIQTCLAAGQTLPLSAAAHVSARFPYSNPPAVIDRPVDDCTPQSARRCRARARYVDGAYYDNSGAAAARSAIQALYEAAHESGVRDRLEIVVIHIYARTIEPSDQGLKAPAADTAAWLDTPLKAVLNARGTRGQTAVTGLCQLLILSDRASDRAGGGAPDQARLQRCDGLPQYRSAGEDEASASIVGAAYDEGDGLPWINAPLDVAAGRTSKAHHYIPLGWLIDQSSHAEIERQSNEAARAIEAILAPPALPASGDRAGSGR